MDAIYRKEILLGSLEARRREVTEYRVNIDNFELAIAQIADDPTMADFKQRLQQLLDDHNRELKKSLVMLNVIEAQCSAL